MMKKSKSQISVQQVRFLNLSAATEQAGPQQPILRSLVTLRHEPQGIMPRAS
jgi:hypothetical protein